MNSDSIFLTQAQEPTEIRLIETDGFAAWREALTADERNWVERQGFTAKSGQTAWLSSEANVVICGWDGRQDLSSHPFTTNFGAADRYGRDRQLCRYCNYSEMLRITVRASRRWKAGKLASQATNKG